jgi:hypothetical protein
MGEKFIRRGGSPIFSTTLTINVRVFFVQFLMGEKFIRRGGSPIFSTSALRSSTSEAGLFPLIQLSGEHLTK